MTGTLCLLLVDFWTSVKCLPLLLLSSSCVTCHSTGVDVDTDHILEMACIVTDGDMNIIAEGPDLIVHHPDSVLDAMGEWCTEHHGRVSYS